MSMEGAKIYGLCLERLKYQIKNARQRAKKENMPGKKNIVLECYNTGGMEDIIDILELYDIEHKTFEAVKEKLDDLAYTVSVLTKETLEFDFSPDGNLCLSLVLKDGQ